MQDQQRDRFYSLLQHYRSASDFEAEPAETLARQLGVPFADVEKQWRDFLQRL